MDGVQVSQSYRATTRKQFTYEWPLKVPYCMNLSNTSRKYYKIYNLPEPKKMKTRNGKFKLLVCKFFAFILFPNTFLREVFFGPYSLSATIEVVILQFHSALQLPS